MTTHTPPPHLLDAISDGSVTTLVQRCEPQPDKVVRGVPMMYHNWVGLASDTTPIRSPFPAPGNPLTILDSNGDAVAEVVVVERGCKQVFVGCNDHEPDESGTQWYFTATVRKDGSYE